jgi:hypothetical protein
LDISRTKQILGQLSERLNSGAATHDLASKSQNSERTHAPTQKKTYAEASSAATTKRPAGPPGSPHKKTGTKPGTSRHTDFGQVIVDFAGPAKQIPSDKIKNALNDLFAKTDARVTGAQFSHTGNLVLTVTPSTSAKLVLSTNWAAATIARLQEPLGLSKREALNSRIYPADPWHRVVVHNIPLIDAQEGPNGPWSWWHQNGVSILRDWKEYNPLSRSVAPQYGKAFRFLVPKRVLEVSLKTKGTVSWCLAFDNAKHAQRLTQEGAFIHGTRCRVSPYRPLPRSRFSSVST